MESDTPTRRISSGGSVLQLAAQGGSPHCHFSSLQLGRSRFTTERVSSWRQPSSSSGSLRVRTGQNRSTSEVDKSRGDRDILSHTRRDAIRVVGVKREASADLRSDAVAAGKSLRCRKSWIHWNWCFQVLLRSYPELILLPRPLAHIFLFGMVGVTLGHLWRTMVYFGMLGSCQDLVVLCQL